MPGRREEGKRKNEGATGRGGDWEMKRRGEKEKNEEFKVQSSRRRINLQTFVLFRYYYSYNFRPVRMVQPGGHSKL